MAGSTSKWTAQVIGSGWSGSTSKRTPRRLVTATIDGGCQLCRHEPLWRAADGDRQRPDLRSPAEARAYLQKLRAIVRALGVSTGNMEEGSFRCDANVSLRPGRRDGVRDQGRSQEHELVPRGASRDRVRDHGRPSCSSAASGSFRRRGAGSTSAASPSSQRLKELAHDYRYFPEPDLPPIFVSREWVAELRARLPELPDARRERFVAQHGLNRYDAVQLTVGRATADFFEESVRLGADPKKVSNWVQGELFRLQKGPGDEDGESTGGLTAARLKALIDLLDAQAISVAAGRQVFEQVYRTGREPADLVESLGLAQLSDANELERLVGEVLTAQPGAVADYRAGKAWRDQFPGWTGDESKSGEGKPQPHSRADRRDARAGSDCYELNSRNMIQVMPTRTSSTISAWSGLSDIDRSNPRPPPVLNIGCLRVALLGL